MALRDHGTSGFLAEFGATPVARRHILRTPDIRRVGFSGKTLTSGSCRFPNVMPASRSFPTTLRRVPTAESASGRVRIPPSPPCVSSPSPARWLTRSSPVFISKSAANAFTQTGLVRKFRIREGLNLALPIRFVADFVLFGQSMAAEFRECVPQQKYSRRFGRGLRRSIVRRLALRTPGWVRSANQRRFISSALNSGRV